MSAPVTALIAYVFILGLLTTIRNRNRKVKNGRRVILKEPVRTNSVSYDRDPSPDDYSTPFYTEDTHKTVPLEAHMHTPDMGTEGFGNEGTDCCHDYMLRPQKEQKEKEQLYKDEPDPEPSVFTAFSGSEEEQAQALLQGLIFSEIYGRRSAMRRTPLRRKY